MAQSELDAAVEHVKECERKLYEALRELEEIVQNKQRKVSSLMVS